MKGDLFRTIFYYNVKDLSVFHFYMLVAVFQLQGLAKLWLSFIADETLNVNQNTDHISYVFFYYSIVRIN